MAHKTHKKSFFAGMAIGAGAALGIRELVRRLRVTGHLGFYGEGHPEHMLEPEDSWTPAHHTPDQHEHEHHYMRATGTTGRTVTSTESELR